MEWQELDSDGFYGLETFLSDGTALDIVEYQQSGEFCWMIRVPIEDAFTTHEVYASYDEDVYFEAIDEALDDCMGYLSRQFPYLAEETGYAQPQQRKHEKIGFLRAAASIGIAAVFSSSLLFGLAAPDEAYADDGADAVVVEQEYDGDGTVVMRSEDGRYYVEQINPPAWQDSFTPGANFERLRESIGIDLSEYIVATGHVSLGNDGLVNSIDGLPEGAGQGVIDAVNESLEATGSHFKDGDTIAYLEVPDTVLDVVAAKYPPTQHWFSIALSSFIAVPAVAGAAMFALLIVVPEIRDNGRVNLVSGLGLGGAVCTSAVALLVFI